MLSLVLAHGHRILQTEERPREEAAEPTEPNERDAREISERLDDAFNRIVYPGGPALTAACGSAALAIMRGYKKNYILPTFKFSNPDVTRLIDSGRRRDPHLTLHAVNQERLKKKNAKKPKHSRKSDVFSHLKTFLKLKVSGPELRPGPGPMIRA
ncbi:hypothetical protein B0H12DRAFT_1241514 [Mycena haematopus]|nr:hypothetical protein B0H12DRAFT_1241514 [Mycena haematopus]